MRGCPHVIRYETASNRVRGECGMHARPHPHHMPSVVRQETLISEERKHSCNVDKQFISYMTTSEQI